MNHSVYNGIHVLSLYPLHPSVFICILNRREDDELIFGDRFSDIPDDGTYSAVLNGFA